MRLQVLSVASEAYPLIKTGGLADVAGALPGALAAEGVAVRTLVPGYPKVMAALREPAVVHRYGDLHGGAARIVRGSAAGLELFMLDAPHLYDRPGGPYADATGRDWPDNAQRFAALARAGADLALGCWPTWRPDVLHAHDWQAGLAPAYLHYAGDLSSGGAMQPGGAAQAGRTAPPAAAASGAARCATVMTVHNLAFQGSFDAHLLGALDLPLAAWSIDGVEYHGAIGFLKAGLALADAITTVSPTYAAEIRSPEAGMGLDGLLRHRSAALTGILNGIDTAVWDPTTDAALAARFNAHTLDARAANKAALQRRFGLAAEARAPLLGVISRLSWQKGLDVLLDAAPELLEAGAQLVVLGAGDTALENGFRALAANHARRVGVFVGYDEALAHQVQAGSDAILVPSRFEPCGLTQLCAQRYGAIPVVARVGGLADTVIDANEMALAAGCATGVQFAPVAREALVQAVRRTMGLYADRAAWGRLQRNAMAADVSWRGPAHRYARLYRALVAGRGGCTP